MLTTTFVHLGDFHAAPGPRNADRYRALDQILREGRQLPVLGAWLWSGDVFDAVSSADDRNALDGRIQQMAMVAPVLICYGNHDRPGDLDGFARLASTWPILVVDRPQCVRIALATGGFATVFVLPYPHKAGLVGAGVAPGAVVSTATDLLEPIFLGVAEELAAARRAGDLTLMIGHVNVAGAVTSTGQPNIGKEIELHPAHLDRLGPIYKGLNHIHRPQEIAGAWYAGSVARQDYGEIEEKRYLTIDVPHDPALRPVVISHPIDIPPMFHVDGRFTRLGFTVDSFDESSDEEIHRRLAAADWHGCDVRVRYRYLSSEKPVLDEQEIRTLFASALRLKIEGVAIPDRELRAPAVAAAKTLPEKLAAMRKVDELPASVAEKVARLEQGTADQLLADVQRTLAALETGEERGVAA